MLMNPPRFCEGQIVMIDCGPHAGPALIESSRGYRGEDFYDGLAYWYKLRGHWEDQPESNLRALTEKECFGFISGS
jgi:hypothetical protein